MKKTNRVPLTSSTPAPLNADNLTDVRGGWMGIHFMSGMWSDAKTHSVTDAAIAGAEEAATSSKE